MRRPLGLVCVVLAVLGLSTATAHATARPSPGKVHHLQAVSHSSTSISLTWTVPAAKAFRSTVIRFAAGTTAPRTSHAGRSAAHLGRTAHSLTVRALTSGRSYAFSLFALDRAGHAGPRVATVVAVAPAPATSVSSFATASSTQLSWKNPTTRTFARVVVRLAKGAAAPTGPTRGRSVRVAGARSAAASVTGLARNTTYAVSVWAFDRSGGYSTPGVARFTTSAGDDPDGTLTGVVQDEAGHGLAGVDISASGESTFGDDFTTTRTDGTYRLSLPADDYTLFVDGDTITGGTSDDTGYVGTVSDATVRSGHLTTAPAIQLAPGAELTGRVVDAAGHPVSGAYAYAVGVNRFIDPDSDGFGSFYESAGAGDGSRLTAADGAFVVRGVPTSGAVRVCASGSDPDHGTACSGRTVLLQPGTSSAVADVVVPTGQGGEVTGTVRGAGKGLADAFVSLQDTGDSDDGNIFLYSPTDANGRYEIDGVPAGTYSVCAQALTVSPAHPTGFAPACTTRLVTVSDGGSAALDVTLPVGAAVTGTVTGPSGQPLAAVDVEVQSSTYGASGRTNSHGQYTVTGLAVGSDQVCFGTGSATGTGLPTGALGGCWHKGAKVALSAGRARSGIDASLARGAALSGTVLNADGTAAAGVQVSAELDSGDDDDYDSSYAQTDAAGHYSVRGLRAGSYSVCFDTVTASGSDLETCDPTPVRVTIGHTTPGANSRLPAASAISVTVVDAGGLPVAGVDAVALSSCPQDCDPQPLFDAKAGVSIDASAPTDAAGTALLDGISPGSYAVCLYAFNGTTKAGGAPTGYADTCSGTTFSVQVTRGATKAVNLVLPVGGAVSGTITDAGGAPLGGVRALVSQSAGTDFVTDDDDFDFTDGNSTDSPESYGYSAADGTYTAIGVQPGARTVCFDATSASGGHSPAGYRDACLGGAPGSTSGTTTVAVTAGGTTAKVDMSLVAAGGLSGTVRHGTAAAPNVQVYVFGARNVHDLIDYTSTAADGSYTVDRLTPGTVTVCFAAKGLPGQCYKKVAWDGSSNPPLDEATLVTVTEGLLVPGIDATLP